MFVYLVHMVALDGGEDGLYQFGVCMEAENPDDAMNRAQKMFDGYARVRSVDTTPTASLEIEEVR